MGAVLTPRRESSVRILLVDQSQGGQARRALLADVGYSITATTCPREAVELLTAEPFDIVVADHPSPHSDAAALIRELRSARSRIAVVLVSAYVDALGISEQSTGADIVIQKSALEVHHLTRAVARLRRRKPSRKPPASVLSASAYRTKTL